MPGLEQYELPHDPNSEHQLHWQPGQHGKGFLTPEGILHHWPTPRIDGDPSHRRYMMEKGMGDMYSEMTNDQRGHLFWIYPEGNIEGLNHGASWGDPKYKAVMERRLQEIDPRLGPINDLTNGWTFGSYNHQQRSLEEKKEMYRTDPVNAERVLDWDEWVGQGDTHTHPHVEWVPTHELAKFMEYDRRPGGRDNASSVERWEALKDHINQHGFNFPIHLEFNPDEGHAHMGEGNHRTQMALDLGIPAMPVRVNRSRRRSPTQIPVNLQMRPEWEDRYSEGGYRVPDSLKPSWIGLPTVPAPVANGWQM